MCLTGFFWLFSHVIYLKLTRVLKECLLSQASILSYELQLYPKKLHIWQFGIIVFGHFIIQKFASLKSKPFSLCFLVRGKSERINNIHFAESSGLRPERQKKKFHYSSLSLEKKALLNYDTFVILR